MPLAGRPASTRPRRPRPATALLQWLVVVAGAGVLALMLGSAEAADDEAGADQRTRGRDLYTQNCAQCHGPQGQGASVRGRPVPAIDDAPVALVRLVMAVGRMPPAGGAFDSSVREVTLTAEERDAILAYVTEEFELTGDVAAPPEGDAARGQDLYATNCAACHGSTGGGGVAGQGAYVPELLDHDPQTIADAARTGPFAMPQFAPGQIPDQELGDIAAFLEAVEEEDFAPLWGSELGPVYASAFAAGLMAVVVIVALVIAGQPMWFPAERRRGEGGDHGDTDGDEAEGEPGDRERTGPDEQDQG